MKKLPSRLYGVLWSMQGRLQPLQSSSGRLIRQQHDSRDVYKTVKMTHQLFKESTERNDSLLVRRDFVELAAELEVERPEGEEQLPGVVVDVAQGHAVHGEAVEGNDPVGRVDDCVLQAGRLASEGGPSGAAAAALVPLQRARVAAEAEQNLPRNEMRFCIFTATEKTSAS